MFEPYTAPDELIEEIRRDSTRKVVYVTVERPSPPEAGPRAYTL